MSRALRFWSMQKTSALNCSTNTMDSPHASGNRYPYFSRSEIWESELGYRKCAERVGVSVPTIGKLEDGDPSTSLVTMLRVLSALGLAADIDLLAAQDTLGRSLQDSELKRPMPKRAKKSSDSEPRAPGTASSKASFECKH